MGNATRVDLVFEELGGEFVVGRITPEQAAYWKHRGARAHAQYVLCDAPDEHDGIPSAIQVNRFWFDLDDVYHSYNPIFCDDNTLIVIDHSTGEEVCRVALARTNFREEQFHEVKNFTEACDPLAFGMTYDQAVECKWELQDREWPFDTLEIEGDFEFSKLHFHYTRIGLDGMYDVIDYVTYDGKKTSLSKQDHADPISRGMAAFILGGSRSQD